MTILVDVYVSWSRANIQVYIYSIMYYVLFYCIQNGDNTENAMETLEIFMGRYQHENCHL